MNRLIIILTAGIQLFLLSSCDQPKDYFLLSNQEPVVELKTLSGYYPELSDLHKLSLGGNYSCIFRYTDDQEICNFEVSNISGSGIWELADSTFYYLPDTIGQHIIELVFIDPYESFTSCRINLNVFWNYPPVAFFTYSVENGILSVDALESFDQDQDYGGYIEKYKFCLDGNEYLLENPFFNQNIDSEIIHIIKLQVQDNDGEWSAVVSDIITVK